MRAGHGGWSAKGCSFARMGGSTGRLPGAFLGLRTIRRTVDPPKSRRGIASMSRECSQPRKNGLHVGLQRVAGLSPTIGRLGDHLAFIIALPQGINDASKHEVPLPFRINFL